MLPRFLLNLFYNQIGTALPGLCLTSILNAQTEPLAIPKKSQQPGIINHLEKLIEIDRTKFSSKIEKLQKERRTQLPTSQVTSIDIDVDFMNSLILHSNPGYLALSNRGKCSLYNSIINDLYRTAEGRISNIILNYTDKKGERGTIALSKKDFIEKIVNNECPESRAIIDQFQIKSIQKTFNDINFETPTSSEHCQSIHSDWLANPKTPYLCNIYEYIHEVKLGTGNLKELAPKRSIVKMIEKKISPNDLDYLSNLCPNLADNKSFCNEYLSVSFWNKISNKNADKIYAEDICIAVTASANPSDALMRDCLNKLKKQPELCSYPAGRNKGLLPQPDCENLSLALNHSHLRANYKDCPSSSDQQGITNLSRVLLNFNNDKIETFNGPCSVISSGTVFEFNKQFNNEEYWKLEACYEDKMSSKEKCYKTYLGEFKSTSESYNNVVANILRNTRGADSSTKCKMIDSDDYNPLLLEYKSGCFIIYNRSQCFMSQCKHKIIFNDRDIDFIYLKNRLTFDYFPANVLDERFSQHYLITKDFNKSGKSLNNLTAIKNFFKKSPKGILHGVGCAEDLLPSFYKSSTINQCSPLPFIIDGSIREGNKTSFVTRTAADSLQAPRIVSWSLVYSAVKGYQRLHPLKHWTLYGLD